MNYLFLFPATLRRAQARALSPFTILTLSFLVETEDPPFTDQDMEHFASFTTMSVFGPSICFSRRRLPEVPASKYVPWLTRCGLSPVQR